MPRFAERHFIDRFLTALKAPRVGILQATDAGARGLTIRVTTEGTKTWVVRYSVRGQGQRKATIGRYPAVSLQDARKRAFDIADAGRRGIDQPRVEAAARAEEARLARLPGTVGDLIDRWVKDYAKPNLRRWKMVEAALNKHVVPRLGPVKLGELRRGDIAELLGDIRSKQKLPAQAEAIRSHLVAILNWAIELDMLQANPAASVRRERRARVARDRVLTDEELRKIWLAADEIGYPGGHIVKMLILTGQRRDEVRRLPWSEIKPDGWHLPAARNKSKRNHHLPLPAAALELLADSKCITGPNKLVFTYNGETPYNVGPSLKRRLDEKSGVTGWVLHDLRRTVRTRLTEMHVHDDVARAIMNHAKAGLDKVYNRAQHQAAMLEALDAWAKRVQRIVANANNVLPIERRA